MNRGILLVIISCLLGGLSTYGADAVGTLKGVVKDPTGAIVAKTAIFVRRNPTKFTPETLPRQDVAIWTDRGARFVTQLQPALYDVCAYSAAFSPNCQTVKVSSGQVQEIEFHLQLSEAFTREYGDEFPTSPEPSAGSKDK